LFFRGGGLEARALTNINRKGGANIKLDGAFDPNQNKSPQRIRLAVDTVSHLGGKTDEYPHGHHWDVRKSR